MDKTTTKETDCMSLLPALKKAGGTLSTKSDTGKSPFKTLDLGAVSKESKVAEILQKGSVKQEIKKQQQLHSGLDLVLAGDLTGSMSSYHRILKEKFTEIATTLFKIIPNLRIGIIFYLDHGSGDPYVTAVQPLTTNGEVLTEFIRQTMDGNGGDADEAVEDALHDVLELNWRAFGARSLVLFGDAGPHEANRCPHGYDYFSLVRDLYEKHVVINSVYCSSGYSSERVAAAFEVDIGDFSKRVSNLGYPKFFSWIANVTGGVAISSEEIDDIVDIIKGLAAKDAGKFEELEAEVKKVSARPIPALEHIKARAKQIEHKKRVLQIGYAG